MSSSRSAALRERFGAAAWAALGISPNAFGPADDDRAAFSPEGGGLGVGMPGGDGIRGRETHAAVRMPG